MQIAIYLHKRGGAIERATMARFLLPTNARPDLIVNMLLNVK